MRDVLVKRNFYKEINKNRITSLVNLYEALCDVAYDPKNEHNCWTEFMTELGYELNINILYFKSKVDSKIEKLSDYIEGGLDKNKNG